MTKLRKGNCMSASNIFIEEIYDDAKNLNLCSSKHQFSEDLAGRSKRWMSTIISQGNEPSTLSLLVIQKNIITKAHATHRRHIINNAKSIVERIDTKLAERISIKTKINENV